MLPRAPAAAAAAVAVDLPAVTVTERCTLAVAGIPQDSTATTHTWTAAQGGFTGSVLAGGGGTLYIVQCSSVMIKTKHTLYYFTNDEIHFYHNKYFTMVENGFHKKCISLTIRYAIIIIGSLLKTWYSIYNVVHYDGKIECDR